VRYLIIFILIWFPSIVFAQIKIGILPIDFKDSKISSQLKENIKKTIYKNLTVQSQIELITLNKKDIKKKESSLNYFLDSSIKISENKAIIELNLLEAFTLKPVYSVKENIDFSQITNRLITHCEEIKRILLASENLFNIPVSEEKSFLSKLNPFTKIDNILSKLFYKKKEFNIKIPIPPPPPPPGYNVKTLPQTYFSENFKDAFSKGYSHEKPYTSSPWQWF